MKEPLKDTQQYMLSSILCLSERPWLEIWMPRVVLSFSPSLENSFGSCSTLLLSVEKGTGPAPLWSIRKPRRKVRKKKPVILCYGCILFLQPLAAAPYHAWSRHLSLFYIHIHLFPFPYPPVRIALI